jgi:TolB-like protein/DNA-binding winged helix-turn-helix (wHTH) protein/Tfp pilus assembly protein PilF
MTSELRELSKLPEHVRFGDGFELDAQAYELRRAGRALKLERIPMEVLRLLVEEKGQLVSRDRIIERVWGKDVFLDTDNSINAAVRKIRQALKDDPEQPRFVQTVTGRGYRFIASVEPVGSAVAERQGVSDSADDSVAASSGTRARLGVNVTASLVLIAAGSWLIWNVRHGQSTAATLRSVVVLPLDNLSGDPSQDYFVDGMTDALTTDLAKVSSLRVTSRTSAMHYKGTKKGIAEIARELGVDGVVEGSVTRSGQRVRITAQLIHAASDRHLWAESYERDLGDILRLQSEVAQAIARQVRAQSSPRPKAPLRSPPSVNPEAYEAYLRGLPYLTVDHSAARDLETARRYFEESVQKDPGFALAHVRLADTYVYLGFFRQLSPERAYRSAKEALRKALELDDGIGEAHATLATLSWRHEWDWAAAEREYELAVELTPSYAWAHSNRSNFLAWQGRREEAAAEIAVSRELEPAYSFVSCESGNYFELRDYPTLAEVSRRGVVSDPNEWLERHFLGVSYEGEGKPLDAIPEYQRAVEMSDGDQDAVAALAHAYAAVGRRAEAVKLLRDLERTPTNSYVSPYLVATVYAGLGDDDKAFELLEEAYRERCWDLAWHIKADLRLDKLRGDPRFQSLLRRIGLPG